MIKFFAPIFACLLANTAFASWVAPVATSSCTRDFNRFGHASVCACPHATRYENRIGQCVQGAPVDIAKDGVIEAEFAIGGETTGTVLVSEGNQTFELIVARDIKALIDDAQYAGASFRVFGEVLEVEGVETGARPTIIVDRIEAIDDVDASDPLSI